MQQWEQRRDDFPLERARHGQHLETGESSSSRAAPERNGWGAAWIGVGAGIGAVVAPHLIASLSNSRLRGGERALAMAAGAVASAAAVKLVDGLVSSRSGARTQAPRDVAVRASITIRRSPGEVYGFWRSLANLPSFMQHIESVSETGEESVWRARGPLGAKLEWRARIVEDEPDERIAWGSLEGATLRNRGKVEFRADPRGIGTEVHVELAFEPPGGAVGAGLARLFDALPEEWLKNDLRRLKQILETGEVVHSDASIHRGAHPARPPDDEELRLIGGKVAS